MDLLMYLHVTYWSNEVLYHDTLLYRTHWRFVAFHTYIPIPVPSASNPQTTHTIQQIQPGLTSGDLRYAPIGCAAKRGSSPVIRQPAGIICYRNILLNPMGRFMVGTQTMHYAGFSEYVARHMHCIYCKTV
jgi:hypothetical protein